MRCLRVLGRAGHDVDLKRLAAALQGTGRIPRLALGAVAEQAARMNGAAQLILEFALEGPLRGDAALLLSHLCCERSLNALAKRIHAPGRVGLYAAAALLSAEDDPFAFTSICERLCDQQESMLAVHALRGAAPGAVRLLEAADVLERWSRRGISSAAAGRSLAATALTAAGIFQEGRATLRALGSHDDELRLLGAEAAFALGDAERARVTLFALLRRGPAIASAAFRLLVQFADLGDAQALALVEKVFVRRPVELSRSAALEALAGARRASLYGAVVQALEGSDTAAGLDAARALARLREPPHVLPPFVM